MRLPQVLAIAATVAVAGACTGGSPSASRETVHPTTGSPTPTPTTTIDPQALLPHDCGTLLTIPAVQRAINRAVFGVHYLREKPLPSGRLGRVTCTWPTRVHAKDQQVPAEVLATVNVYGDHDTVEKRMRLTIATDTANGNTISHTTVDGHSATLDAGVRRTTLLLPLDVRVLVLQVDHPSVPADRAADALRSLAAIALRSLPPGQMTSTSPSSNR